MALPFELATTSLGFALLTRSLRELGVKAAGEAARVLGELSGGPVSLSGRTLPCVPAPGAGVTRLRLELTALPGTAVVEVEASLAAALLDRLSGGAGDPQPATDVTPLERAALELAVLSVIDAVAGLPEIESRLAPRLARTPCEPLTGLAIHLDVAFAGGTGRARLILPASAVRSLRRAEPPDGPGALAAVELSIRSGVAPLGPEDLDALEPGDVVLLDVPAGGRLRAVAPGGLTVAGSEAGDDLMIEEVRMADTSSECTLLLEVELARVPVTIGELVRLEPGSVLPLPIDRRGLVTLRVGERTFGRGELVDVEGAVGVRIDALLEVQR